MVDDDGYIDGSDTALGGELMLPEGAGRGRGKRAYLDEDTIAQIIRERLKGRPLREIGEEFGVSRTTVRNYTEGHITQKVSVDVSKVRARIGAELEAAKHEAWKIFMAFDHPKIKLDALTRVESLLGNQATLYGAKMPVRVDLTITEVTEAERELQELIREAQARVSGSRAQVIADATADEGL
jgi:hypothetical protein